MFVACLRRICSPVTVNKNNPDEIQSESAYVDDFVES